MNRLSKIEVYTDGHCNLCRWMRARVEPPDRDHRIEWLDYNDPEILQRAAPHTREEMAEEMHTRTADGHWSKGYFAWIEVIRALPRWLAPILSCPFTKLGPVFITGLPRVAIRFLVCHLHAMRVACANCTSSYRTARGSERVRMRAKCPRTADKDVGAPGTTFALAKAS